MKNVIIGVLSVIVVGLAIYSLNVTKERDFYENEDYAYLEELTQITEEDEELKKRVEAILELGVEQEVADDKYVWIQVLKEDYHEFGEFEGVIRDISKIDDKMIFEYFLDDGINVNVTFYIDGKISKNAAKRYRDDSYIHILNFNNEYSEKYDRYEYK